MSISLTPCNLLDRYGLEVNEQCITDTDKQKDHLAKKYYYPQLIYNYEVFDPEKYNDAAILKQSKLTSLSFNNNLSANIHFDL